MAANIGPFLEGQSGGCVRLAGAVGLGVPEVGGDGLSRVMVGTGQVQRIMGLRYVGQAVATETR